MQNESFAMLVLRNSPCFIDTGQSIGAHLGIIAEVVHALWTILLSKKDRSRPLYAVPYKLAPVIFYVHNQHLYLHAS